ncbi:ribonuclease H-like domain-containing protein [Sporosarcina sp. Marseille-Q4063]|uniref:ribonuclease H-like domain-containing protein n=1 Tax=Sporosarcina sp. Marseille-Q4063 TaxID=2810514 RepID=UPI001BB0CEAB|nr:ribonuclease H-like domain-containing protein [Sporosarcina sp. Marseille-Q4063]QUW22145.1 ribonuclease H-like domain-containing protein [Sporosarcina sp. Marseille-Q4063]
MSYEKKLMEMRKLVKKTTKEKPAQEKKKVVPPPPFYEGSWLSAGLTKEENSHGFVYKRTISFDSTYKHGNIYLSDLKLALKKWEDLDLTHPLAPDLEKRLVFFDTETTGLKGAGTLIFLLGFIEQRKNSFQLTQYLLPGPDHEPAFLYASGLWEHNLNLVTYNGKSFDLPQVETRWTMNRNSLPPLASHAHIDLLHGSRRIWKEEVDSFSLVNIEEKKIGFYREDDIPGHLAPIIYQDAVKSGRIDPLMKVLKHNEWDILSLVALFIESTDLLFETSTRGTAISQTNIGKWFADLKLYDRSSQVLEAVILEYGLEHPVTHFHFGFIMKRNLAVEEAISSFVIAADRLDGRQRIIALEELAKLYEHKVKEFEKALLYTRRAQHLLTEDPELTDRFRARQREMFQKREIRIVRKLFPG